MDSQIIWSPGVTLEAIEKQVILTAFRFYRGNKTATAQALGIAVRTLDNKLDQYKVHGTTEDERVKNERAERERFLARSRGQVPDNVFTGDAPAKQQIAVANENKGTADVPGAAAGTRMEPASGVAEKQSVPVSQRKEVQGVLPGQAAASGAGKRR